MSSVACTDDPDISVYGWRARFDYEPPVKCKPFTMPRMSQIPDLLSIGIRYIFRFYIRKRFWEKKRPFIDGIKAFTWLPIYGVPVGGMGGGTIGRGFKGEFCRFNMVPGLYEQKIVHANQFIVTIWKRGHVVYQQVLSPHKPNHHEVGDMSSWNWGFCPQHAEYTGLYPRSWTVYNIPSQDIKLICRQMSPLIPGNYKDSCLPVGVFVWQVINKGKEPVDVSITFTFKNGQGISSSDTQGGVWGDTFQEESVKGCLLHQEFNGMQCTYGIATDNTDTRKASAISGFLLNSSRSSTTLSASRVWSSLLQTGALPDSSAPTPPTQSGQELVIAVSSKIHVLPGTKEETKFVLTWHMPLLHFRTRKVQYKRRYIRWFSEEMHKGTVELLSYALNMSTQWERAIVDWQAPILAKSDLPDWYKSAIFNELYFLADGGTVWLDSIHDTNQDQSTIKKEIGYFGYLEGHEYRMYNTYDVHYYASWALISLWPKVQLAIQYDVAHATLLEDGEKVYYIHNGYRERRSTLHSVPHDLGDPEDEPWSHVNSYIMYNTNEWKDLNSKFVLQVFRDWTITKDRDYLEYMTPIAIDVIERSVAWDTDGDGIIDNGGYADQTYDAWSVSGASAYTGGLWLAALYAVIQLAKECGKELDQIPPLLTKAKESYEKKLWHSSYYKYDNSPSSYNTSIMSDQTNGHWYLKLSGVADNEVFPQSNIQKALHTIFEHNVEGVGAGLLKGRIGAINGYMPTKRKDTSSVHSEEFWVGVNYALASTMALEGMRDLGLSVAEGTYKTVYERYGLQFQTPEAYLDDGRFRSLGYMRPLSIWSLHRALTLAPPTCNGDTPVDRQT